MVEKASIVNALKRFIVPDTSLTVVKDFVIHNLVNKAHEPRGNSNELSSRCIFTALKLIKL